MTTLPDHSGWTSDGQSIVVYLDANLDPVENQADAQYVRILGLDGSSEMMVVNGAVEKGEDKETQE